MVARDSECVSHLAEDLRLAYDERVEAGSYPVQVPDGVALLQGVQVRGEFPVAAHCHKERIQRVAAGLTVAGDRVNLGAIAGGHDNSPASDVLQRLQSFG
jgi:hypothetical protein